MADQWMSTTIEDTERRDVCACPRYVAMAVTDHGALNEFAVNDRHEWMPAEWLGNGDAGDRWLTSVICRWCLEKRDLA